jgi:hypothetical protein
VYNKNNYELTSVGSAVLKMYVGAVVVVSTDAVSIASVAPGVAVGT